MDGVHAIERVRYSVGVPHQRHAKSTGHPARGDSHVETLPPVDGHTDEHSHLWIACSELPDDRL